MMPHPIQPETPRLLLRQWRPEDRAPFAAMNANPEVMRYFPSLLRPEESDAMADHCQQLIDLFGWGFWALELKETGAFIGCCGLHTPMDKLPFAPCVEVGWRLARPYWGQGHATAAATAALEVAFEQLNLEQVVSFTALDNLRSKAVMERLGMQPDGQFEHPALPEGHPLRPHWLYRKDNPLYGVSP